MRSIFTVTTPVSEASLLTIEELRSASGDADPSRDDALMALGRQVSEAIAVSCGVAWDGVHPRTLLSEECREVFTVRRPSPHLKLARRPVTAIASVMVDGIACNLSEFEIDMASGLLSSCIGNWPCGRITVSFIAGFAAAPGSLVLAASKLATALHADAGRDPSLKRIDIPDVVEKEFWVAPAADPLLSTEIQDLLSPFKQVW